MLFVLCSIAAAAQEKEYHPFCEEGKVWISQQVYVADTSYVFNTKEFILAGDTIIGGRSCKKMNVHTFDRNLVEQSVTYEGAYYEEDGKVLCFPVDSQTAALKYDFTISEGCPLIIDEEFPVIVAKDIYTDGDKGMYNRYIEYELTQDLKDYLQELFGDWEECLDLLPCGLWCEGIGNLYGPPTVSIYDTLRPTGLSCDLLISCSVGDQYLFSRKGYENLVRDVVNINPIAIPSPITLPTYDLSGRVYPEHLSKGKASPNARGIYIESGKKVVR